MVECEVNVRSSDGFRVGPRVERFFRDGLESAADYLGRCGYTMSGGIQVYVFPECTPSVGGVYYGHEGGTHYIAFPSLVADNRWANIIAHEVAHAAHAENTVDSYGNVWSRVQKALQDPTNNIRPVVECPASAELLIGEMVSQHVELRWIEDELGKQYSLFDTKWLRNRRSDLYEGIRTSLILDAATMTYADCYPAALRIGGKLRLKHFPKMKSRDVVRTFLDIDWCQYNSGNGDTDKTSQLTTLFKNPSSIAFINGNTFADEFPVGNRYFYRRKKPKNTA